MNLWEKLQHRSDMAWKWNLSIYDLNTILNYDFVSIQQTSNDKEIIISIALILMLFLPCHCKKCLLLKTMCPFFF